MRGEAVGLRVSPSGNGCGLAVVALLRDGGLPLVVRISVLPRMWPNEGPAVLDLDADPEPDGSLIIDIFEMQQMLIVGRLPGLARRLAEALIDVRFDDEVDAEDQASASPGDENPAAEPEPVDLGAETGRQVPLFSELGPAATRDLAGRAVFADARSAILRHAFWQLVESADAHDLIGIPHRYADRMDAETYLASTLLAHAPELRPLMRRQFIREAEAFLGRRRAHFRPESDHLMAVRGRIDLRGIPRRAATGTVRVTCEFDELDHNSPWQQLLRSAARMAAREESDQARATGRWSIAARAAQVERRLGDADLLTPRAAYERCRTTRIPRYLQTARGAITLAQGLIVGRYPLGLEDDANMVRPGVAAAVRIPTAKLFERLLATLAFSDGTRLRPANSPVLIRQRGRGKAPDLRLVTATGETAALVDAKYKPQAAPMRLSAMPMADQYQQYSYAAATGLPTLFVYVLSDPHHRGPATHDHDTIVISGSPGPRIAVIAIPFPAPDQARDLPTWQRAADLTLRPCLDRLR